MSDPKVPYHVRRNLKRKNVELVDEGSFTLQCTICNHTWTPEIEGRKRMPKNYWRCPNGCNVELGEQDKKSALNVLLVDDDVPLNRTLSAIMRKAGYEVVNVFNGTDMLDELNKKSFDAVIMDIRLPDIDGTELLQRVKEKDPVTGTLMMSGAATLEDAVESLNYGADAFILKPVEPGDFLYRLGVLTGFKRLERELRQAKVRYNELFTIVNESEAS
jgi:PleD family two-component response regulator